MSRAPATHLHQDPLNLNSLNLNALSQSLPVIPTTATNKTATHPPPSSNLSILNIHISYHIKFQVTSVGTNFSKWRQIILLLLRIYKALDHVTEGAAPADSDDDWLAVDIHISLWFLATLSDDLHFLVVGADGRTGTTWARLHQLFLNNATSRYNYLSKAFRNCRRGDLPIATYASKL
jgi:hypothetical protein